MERAQDSGPAFLASSGSDGSAAAFISSAELVTRAALSDALDEDEERDLMRAAYGLHWSIGVDHGEWEAMGLGTRKRYGTLKAKSAVLLAAKIEQVEYEANGGGT